MPVLLRICDLRNSHRFCLSRLLPRFDNPLTTCVTLHVGARVGGWMVAACLCWPFSIASGAFRSLGIALLSMQWATFRNLLTHTIAQSFHFGATSAISNETITEWWRSMVVMFIRFNKEWCNTFINVIRICWGSMLHNVFYEFKMYVALGNRTWLND